MTKLQKVYRELRKHASREDARYAAPRLIELGANWLDAQWAAQRNRNEARLKRAGIFGEA